MSLQGQVIYVSGGCGIVGSGIALSLVEHGAKVWVSSREYSRFEELKAIVPQRFHIQLEFFNEDITNELNCLKLKDEILKKEGKINHVISSIGGWVTLGKLSDISVESFQKELNDNAIAHFVVYKTFVKELAQTPNSTFIFISGGSAEAKYFEPTASTIPIGSSCVHGIYISASSEFKEHQNLALIEFRLFLWIRKQADINFDQSNSEYEVGHDYIGKFIPKLIIRHKSDLYRITCRSQGDQLYEEFHS